MKIYHVVFSHFHHWMEVSNLGKRQRSTSVSMSFLSLVFPFFQFLMKSFLSLKSRLIIYAIYHLRVIKYIWHIYLKGDWLVPWGHLAIMLSRSICISFTQENSMVTNIHKAMLWWKKGKMGGRIREIELCVIHVLKWYIPDKNQIVTCILSIEGNDF